MKVLYHANCMDGFGAAWAAYKYFGSSAEYIPVQYGSAPPDTAGDDLLIVDFSYPKDVLLDLAAQSSSVTIIDHHKTAKDALTDPEVQAVKNIRTVFDMERSGAVLTWMHLHDAPVPQFLQYIEDRDLWRWQLPMSREINAAMGSHPFDFAVWDRFEDIVFSDLCAEGEAILRAQGKMVDKCIKHPGVLGLNGVEGPCVNSTLLKSEIGHALCQGKPFAAVFMVLADKVVVSLRSDDNGLDVAEIAGQFGGGGHKHAAGFSLPFGSFTMRFRKAD